ncbi:bifunctional diguanylate cyclase/phosphodiesterase [Rubrivivax rivuli]|uniref:EAL domain-containing protein n=1 Tax=Rubrivivax rivuli TaxID=1862385 RepID=A0A437RGU8_9BURK|nr:EAL domain-containing protein [Rubrivivax rivuli]RVU45958.1 EAL domain-containing protein [Rubrivivax rivuli]
MRFRPAWTVPRLLYLLAAGVIAPMALLVSYNVWQQYQSGKALAQAEALRLAQLTADTAETFIKDARGVLTTLAQRRQMLAKITDPGQPCDEIFPTFKEFYPQLSNMSLSTPAGFLVCSSLPQPDNQPLPVAHMAWFQQVYQRKDFVVGPIVYGPINKNWITVLAEPVRDGSGKMVGALQTPIDLLKFRLVPAAERLPSKIFIAIVDIRGNVVARSREAERFVGSNLLDKSEILRIAVKQRQGTAESVGAERIPRFYGFTPVAGTDWIAMAGIDADYALASVTRSAQASAMAAAGIVVLVMLLAVLLSRRIARPIHALSVAARRAGGGGLDVRVPTDGPIELAEVGREFNLMLDAIGDTQARLQHSQARLKLALEGSRMAIWDLEIHSGSVYLSETWSELLGGPHVTTQLSLRGLLRLIPDADRTLVTAAFRKVLRQGEDDLLAEHRFKTRTGQTLWVATQGRVSERDAERRASRMLGVIVDISERRHRDDEIHRLAFFDTLTSLPNRRMLTQEVTKALARARRARLFGALMFIDLDRFKSINDARGHATGDALLKTVAARLQALTREGDTVARMGGDEFVVLATGLADNAADAARSAHLLAEKMRAALEVPYEIDQQFFTSSASIGVALLVMDDQTVDNLLREADIAMYRAKSAGRNQIAFFQASMQAEVEQRLTVENDLAQAIERQQMSLHAQSQMDAKGRLIGAELLLRWRHPEQGMIPPLHFIEVAEETGLIVRIGDWVLNQACLLVKELRATGHDIPLSVNISPRQFRFPGFTERVQEVLQAHDVPGSSLIFEVTESLLVGPVDATILRMNELRAVGIRFSIDDFGTGYSSLAYLKRLPLYELKIDKSFVDGIPDDHNDTEIVQMVISLAKLLKLRVVAEGVETLEQANFLTNRGCESMQGYFFRRPVPTSEWLVDLRSGSLVRLPAP